MSDRTPCYVPGCRRTASATFMAGHSEFLCGKHYQLVDRRVRRLRTRVRRKALKIGWTASLQVLAARLWDRAKRQATERAMGI